jgi:hypothetical protein
MRRLGTALINILSLTGMAAGVVDAQSPSPEPPPWFGGRVEMPEHGFAVTVPDGWAAFASSGDPVEQARNAAALIDPGASEEGIDLLAQALRARQLAGGPLWMYELEAGSLTLPMWGCTVGVDPGGSVVPRDAAGLTHARLSSTDGVEGLTPVESLALPAGPAARFSFRLSLDGLSYATYVGSGESSFFLFACSAETPPDDLWLSLAETFEFLPAEE